tara:strand:+ start:639 stop:1382 length:744 start_codon:yes stop_codon:yes gene_type:complete
MKITTSELKQIIKEEAERFAKIKTLSIEKNKIENQINEMYNEDVDENESVEESMVEGIEGMELTEPVSVEDNVDESNSIEEGKVTDRIKDWFSKEGTNVEDALKKLQEHVIKMIESHDIPNEVKERLKKSAEGAAKKLYDQASGSVYDYEPVIKYYPSAKGKNANDPDRKAQYGIIMQKAAPNGPWQKMIQVLVGAASDDLKGRGLSYQEGVEGNIQETVKSEVKKAIKAEKLKSRAQEIIKEMKSL